MHDSPSPSPPQRHLADLPRFLTAWCDTMGVSPQNLADRAEVVKDRWTQEKRVPEAQLKRFGSSRPHFYRLLKGEIPVEANDQMMLIYLSEIFEMDVVQLFDTLAQRVWPLTHLSPGDYIEVPLQSQIAQGIRYLMPPEQLTHCSMHHLYLEINAGGQSGIHRHVAGTEMIRLDQGEAITLHFPERPTHAQQVILQCGDTLSFNATLQHQIVNHTQSPARMLVIRNYELQCGEETE